MRLPPPPPFRPESPAAVQTEARSGKLFPSRPRWRSMLGFMIGIAPLKKLMIGSPLKSAGGPPATVKTEARSGKLFPSRPRCRSMIGFMIGVAPLKKFMIGSLLKSKEELPPV